MSPLWAGINPMNCWFGDWKPNGRFELVKVIVFK